MAGRRPAFGEGPLACRAWESPWGLGRSRIFSRTHPGTSPIFSRGRLARMDSGMFLAKWATPGGAGIWIYQTGAGYSWVGFLCRDACGAVRAVALELPSISMTHQQNNGKTRPWKCHYLRFVDPSQIPKAQWFRSAQSKYVYFFLEKAPGAPRRKRLSQKGNFPARGIRAGPWNDRDTARKRDKRQYQGNTGFGVSLAVALGHSRWPAKCWAKGHDFSRAGLTLVGRGFSA